MRWLDATPLWLIGLSMTVLLIGAEELGVRARRLVSAQVQRKHAESETSEAVSNLVAAALGLLALIFGFTYAMAQDRYDQRTGLVMAEARAVATSYMRYQALDEPERGRLGQLMRQYAVLRSSGFDPHRDPVRLDELVGRTERMQSQIWDQVLAGLRRRPELIEPVMESTNQMFEITANRRAIVDARIPASTQLGLILFALMSAFFTGYGLMLDREHRGAVAALFLLFTFVYLLILDLDRSYSGGIHVSQAPMTRAAQSIERLEAAKAVEPAARTESVGRSEPP